MITHTHIYIYIYIYIYTHTYTYIILSRINRLTMNLLLKNFKFLLQSSGKCFTYKIFLDFLLWKTMLTIYKHLGIEEFSSNITIKSL